MELSASYQEWLGRLDDIRVESQGGLNMSKPSPDLEVDGVPVALRAEIPWDDGSSLQYWEYTVIGCAMCHKSFVTDLKGPQCQMIFK